MRTGLFAAAGALSRHFKRVIATDPNQEQLKRAPHLPNVDWQQGFAEDTKLPAACADLVTVATAMHW